MVIWAGSTAMTASSGLIALNVPEQFVVSGSLPPLPMTNTNADWFGGEFRHSYLRQRVIFEDTSTLARLAGWLLILLLCLFVIDSLKAQTPDPSPTGAPQPEVRPPLSPFPRYQDWSFLRDPAKRVDPYDRLKFIPLNDSGKICVTLGLENRTEFQYLNSNVWGAGPQDHSGYVLQR